VNKYSKFTKHFYELEAKTNIVDDGTYKNDYYAPVFIKFLQKYFMPYCFIWSGFVLKGLNVTRTTNGSIKIISNIKNRN
jgi:hypothetical protein